MFVMFCLGLVIGAAWLGTILACFSTRPEAYKIAVILMLFAILASEWVIANADHGYRQQYNQLSGGRGDGL